MLQFIGRHPEGIPPRPRVLDVGCGQGHALSFLNNRWNVVGTDVSHEMLLAAPKRVKVAVQDRLALPFADGTFDIAFAFCVYHHVSDGEQSLHLQEVVRTLRPGARLFVFEHNPYNPVTQIVFRRAPVDRDCTMIPPARMRRMFAAAELSDVTTGYLLFTPQPVAARAPWVDATLRWLPLGGQYYVSGRKRGRPL
ncbi:MAG: Methyltransferase type 11 [Acidobacteria bacterium]|nr:Methyltransferase type 11 [Acidobacteriota bacterium]